MNRTSSTYKLILCSEDLVRIPVIVGEDLILSARGSIERAKIRGDRGHPCCVPLVMGKWYEKKTVVKTEADGQVYKEHIAS